MTKKVSESSVKKGMKIGKGGEENQKESAKENANKKRFAIQFYGYLRSYKECRDSFFTHIVAPLEKSGYEVDIFMHSWDFIEGRVSSWDFEQTTLEMDLPQKTPSKEELATLYNLKGIAITPQATSKNDEKFLQNRWIGKYRYKSLANAYYSLFCVNQLRLEYEKQNEKEYEFVLVTRPDLLFDRDFRLNFLDDGSMRGKNFRNKLFGYYVVMERQIYT